MSRVIIRIPMPLRSYTGGGDQVVVEAGTVRDALQAMGTQHDGILGRVLAPDGEVRQYVNVFLGNRNIRALDGLATPLADGEVIAIIPAVAGGGT